MIPAALEQTLHLLAASVEGAADDWWIIGSTAVLLHGADLPAVKDVDIVMSVRDAAALLGRVGSAPVPAVSEQFRSDVFGVWLAPPVPVEVMGGFRYARNGGWRAVGFSTRVSQSVGGVRLYVPSVAELADLLLAFGRPKDLARAAMLGRGVERR